MKPLDASAIEGLIKTLQTILQGGFSALASSPVDLLLESAIDLSVLLSHEFAEGSQKRKNTPGLKFSQRWSDPLGNPKQIKIRFESEIVWDPQAALFFKELASFLVLLKKGGTFSSAFMALVEKFPHLIRNPPVSPKGFKKESPKEKIARANKTFNSKQFYRRHQKDK